jgi:hypothetical protein
MSRFLPSTFTRSAQLQAASGAALDFGCVRARLGLAFRFCAAAVLGLAVVVGSLIVWAVAAMAIAVFGDVPPRRRVGATAGSASTNLTSTSQP